MTIAQQLKIKEFPFEIKDSNGKEIYYEDSSGYVEDNRPKHNKLTPDQIIEQLESLNPQQIIEVITKLIEQCHN